MGEKGTERISKTVSALTALHARIREGATIEEIAGEAARDLADVTGCRKCAVFLVGEDGVNIMAEMGREGEFRVEPVVEYFLGKRVTIFTGDLSTSAASVLIAGDQQVNSLICSPVMTDGGPVGFVLLSSRRRNAFEKDDLHFVELLAEELSTVLMIASLRKAVGDLTIRDALTGCFTWEKFDEDIDVEIPCSERYGRPLSLLLIAVEGIRERDGSSVAEGDALLKRTGEILSYSIRMCDKLYRYGDDKFALMLPGIDRARAEFAARRLARVISRNDPEKQPEAPESRKVTVTIGIASFPTDAVYRDGLIKFLESDLQRARESGGENGQ